MTANLYYAFNGDADGLCALQQLRLTDPRPCELVTGVKRDINLLERVPAQAGDECVVLDVSLDVNRAGLVKLLEAGVTVRYFDHHFAGEIPQVGKLESYIDTAANVCTSLLVDRYLRGQKRAWAVTGLFGDSLNDEATALAAELGLSPEATKTLKELGVGINYNAYGETVSDLHVPPLELAEKMLEFPDPLAFAASSPAYRRLASGYREDMAQANRLAPTRRGPGALLYVMPDEVWARRVIGTLANDLAKANAGSAVAILSPKTDGYVVSLRVPRDSKLAADEFCRRFPTGGGRRTAAGVNHLPAGEVESFANAFEAEYRAG
ncbi:MAG TPA: DHH family phosphoesterase [Polyangiaceae bacterium]